MITPEELARGKEQLKSSLIMAQENTATQMIAYGKYMLYNDSILDMEKRIRELGALTLDDCALALEGSFHTDHAATAAVGKIDAPLRLPR